MSPAYERAYGTIREKLKSIPASHSSDSATVLGAGACAVVVCTTTLSPVKKTLKGAEGEMQQLSGSKIKDHHFGWQQRCLALAFVPTMYAT